MIINARSATPVLGLMQVVLLTSGSLSLRLSLSAGGRVQPEVNNGVTCSAGRAKGIMFLTTSQSPRLFIIYESNTDFL